MYNFASLFFVSKLSLDRFFDFFLLSLSLSRVSREEKSAKDFDQTVSQEGVTLFFGVR